MDITNNISSIIPSHENTITGHGILREVARRDLQIYTDKMANQMNKGRKRIMKHQIGDLVRVIVPKIDRFGVDRPTLPCKILKKTNDDKYQLGSKFGILEIYYSANEIESLGTAAFPELDNIPSNKISVREASRLQSVGSVTGGICNCKTDCNNNKCRCKRTSEKCTSRCHGGRPCQNKN